MEFQNVVRDIDGLIDFLDQEFDKKFKLITIVPLHKEDWDNPEKPEYMIVFTLN